MSDEFPLHLLSHEESSVIELDSGTVEVTPHGLAWSEDETPEDHHQGDTVL